MDIDLYDNEVNVHSIGSEASFVLTRGSGEERIERKLRKSQIYSDRLSFMCMLEKSSVHLVDEFNSQTEWPNKEGRFDLRSFVDGSILLVEGTKSLSANQSPLSPSLSTFPMSCQTKPYSQMFSSVIPSSSLSSKAKKARVQPYSLKVTYASLEGGKIKNPVRQIYVLINDETANVDYIKKQCEEELNINDVVLATANGLFIEDSAGTRGLPFWKSTARKIFAVKAKVKKENDIVIIEDNDKTGVNQDSRATNASAILSAIELQTNDLKSYLDDKFENAVKNRLWANLEELFKCVICHETAKPAIKFGGCCGSVLSCEPCLNQWYEDNENCPKCRALYGKSDLFTIRGFDDICAKLRDVQT